MTCWGDVLKRRAGQLRQCGIIIQFRPDVATCVGMEWMPGLLGIRGQVATSAEPPAKKRAVLASVVNRLRHRVSGVDRKTGTVHALGDSLGTVPVLLRKIRYVGRFLIPGPAPRRSWLAMTEGRRACHDGLDTFAPSSLRWVVGVANVGFREPGTHVWSVLCVSGAPGTRSASPSPGALRAKVRQVNV